MPKEQSLQKAMDYIEKNLTKDISYYDIAREAGISVPHFYRLFKRLTAISDQSVIDEHQMKFSLLHTEGFIVAGLECRAVQWDSDGAIGRLWSEFLARLEKIQLIQDKVTMYGICEHETCRNEGFTYMAAIGIDSGTDVPPGMTKKFISPQNFFQASVPDRISTPDAYAGAIGYARSLGYVLKDNDIIEVYDGIFQNPDVNRFRLLIPIM